MEMRQYAKAILIVLLAIGIPGSQIAALAASHSLAHSSHCCGVCHTGHLSILQAAEHFVVSTLTIVSWHRPAERATYAPEPVILTGRSRAPPA